MEYAKLFALAFSACISVIAIAFGHKQRHKIASDGSREISQEAVSPIGWIAIFLIIICFLFNFVFTHNDEQEKLAAKERDAAKAKVEAQQREAQAKEAYNRHVELINRSSIMLNQLK